MNAKVTSYEQIEKIAKSARKLKGEWEVRCLSLPITRCYTMEQAIRHAKRFQGQVDAEVTVHWIG